MDYEKDFDVDPLALDLEYLRDARLTRDYCKALADSQAKLRQIDETVLPASRAELAHHIRKNPSLYGIEKLTEGALNEILSIALVKLTVTNDLEGRSFVAGYQEAHQEYLELIHEVDDLKGCVRACDKHTESLKGLIFLFGKEYFAGPVIPRNIGEKFQEYVSATKEVRRVEVKDRIRERMNGRKDA